MIAHDPPAVLGPLAELPCVMAPVFGSPTRYTVELEWMDDSGEPGIWRSELSL